MRRFGSTRDKAAMAVLLIVLFLRLGFSALIYARPELALANDTDRYVPIANAILSHTAYAWSTDRPGELLNTVGYPLFLAGVYLILGRGAGNVALAQLILSGVLVLIIYLYLTRAVGTLPAMISALLFAVEPLTILWSLTVLTETLFAALLGVATVMIAEWAVTKKDRFLLLAGIFMGLACLDRPYAELLLVLWAAAIMLFPDVLSGGKPRRLIQKLSRAALFIVPSILLIAPWVVRNAVLWDCPTLSSVDRVTMRDYVAAKIISVDQHIPLGDAQSSLQAQDPGNCPRHTSQYLQIVLSHPRTYAELQVAGTIPVLVGTSSDRWLQLFGIDYSLPDLWGPFMDGGPTRVFQILQNQYVRFPLEIGLMASLIALQLLTYLVALTGLFFWRKVQDVSVRWWIILVAVSICVLVVAPGQGGNERFRVPVEPLLICLFAYGLQLAVLPFIARLRNRRPVPDEAH